MVAARRRSASSGPLRGLQRHVRRRARSCVQSNLPAMPTIGEGGLIPPISGQSRYLRANPRCRATLSEGIARLEAATGFFFGGARRPLLVSVRSGGAISMPGMMETVLDVGLNSETVAGLVRMTGNPRLAWDSYRRFDPRLRGGRGRPSHGALRCVGGRCAETRGSGNRTRTRSSRSSRIRP